MIEREVKLRFASVDEARAVLQAAGAAPLRRRRLQDDALYDTAEGALRARRCALRVRQESGVIRLTFKGPPQPGLVKQREEHETVVEDGAALLRVLEALGYRRWFRYQKYREEFSAPDVVVALDETPVGTFVEIEGSEDGIVRMAGAMGRDHGDFILESYRALFVRDGRACGVSGPDMLFTAPAQVDEPDGRVAIER